MDFYTTFFVGAGVLTLAYNRNYLSHLCNSIKKGYNKAFLVSSLLIKKSLISYLDKSQVDGWEGFDDFAILSYSFLGTRYRITVPYDRSQVARMVSMTVQLFREGEFINITHQPGIPYTQSAKELGGSFITVTNEATGRKTNYHQEERPMYCSEILDLD